MTVTPESPSIPDPPASGPESGAPIAESPTSAQNPAASSPVPVPVPVPAPATSPVFGAPIGSAPVHRKAGLPFRPAVLLVALLAIVAMIGVIVVFGDDGGGAVSVKTSGGSSGSPSGGGTLSDPVRITNPAALAPPQGVAVPPSRPGAVLEWKTDQDWSTVLTWYYSSFPIEKMALDPAASGRSSTRGVPTGESHRIIAEGTTQVPGLSPYLQISADPAKPTGSIVSYYSYE